jgi:hypothetical protein
MSTKRSKEASAETSEVRTRLPAELLERIDAWRAQQEDKPSRPEAVKRLLTSHFWPGL